MRNARERYAQIEELKGEHTVQLLCEILAVSSGGYYKWRKHLKTKRQEQDEQLMVRIKEAHRRSRGNYGTPRIVAELAGEQVHISRRRCGRLMRQIGVQGRKHHARKPRTTDSRHGRVVPENRLAMMAPPSGPNQAWITDITYVRTQEGWMYLAAILDLWSRRVIGWACAATLHVWLVLEALGKALNERHPPVGTLHHSDRGSQYASEQYTQALSASGLSPSMSNAGNCYDNATMESFWSTLKTETGLDQTVPPTRGAAELAVFDYIETFYNPLRRHSSLDYLSPVAFEQQHEKITTKAA